MIWLIGFSTAAVIFLVGLFLHEYYDFRLYFLIVNGPHKVVVLDYDPEESREIAEGGIQCSTGIARRIR